MAECSSMAVDCSPKTRQLKDIIDSLTDLGYEGPLLQEKRLEECLDGGLESTEFIQFVTWLCNDIAMLLKLEESISTGLGTADADVLKVELKGLLTRLQCPYRFLTKDLDILLKVDYRYVLIEFLTSELQTTRLIALDQLDEKVQKVGNPANILARDATISILKSLHFSEPPAHVTFETIVSKLIEKVKGLAVDPNYFGTSFFSRRLRRDQWAYVERLNTSLEDEFRTRRQLLLTRLEVTLQAFTWKKDKAEQVEKVIQREVEAGLPATCPIPLSHLLAAREDLADQSKTSNYSVLKNTHSTIHKFKMGNVPDRGGRAWETRPPPEMPSFQPRVEHPKTDNRGGRQGQFRQSDFQKSQPQNWGRSYGHESRGNQYQDRTFNNDPRDPQHQARPFNDHRGQRTRPFNEPRGHQYQGRAIFGHGSQQYFDETPPLHQSMSYEQPRYQEQTREAPYGRTQSYDHHGSAQGRGDQRRQRGGGYQRRGRGQNPRQGTFVLDNY